jgi:hypothetical protein
MNRVLIDSEKLVTRALPAQNTNVNSASIDFGTPPAPEAMELRVSVPATPLLANAQTITVTFQDSADNSSFAAIPELATLVITGGGGVGAAAAVRDVNLPASARRYVRVNIAASATAGDNTAVSATLAPLF